MLFHSKVAMISREKLPKGQCGKARFVHCSQLSCEFCNVEFISTYQRYRAKSVIALITSITDSLQFGELGGASIYTIQYIHHDNIVCGIEVVLPAHIKFASNGFTLSTFFAFLPPVAVHYPGGGQFQNSWYSRRSVKLWASSSAEYVLWEQTQWTERCLSTLCPSIFLSWSCMG